MSLVCNLYVTYSSIKVLSAQIGGSCLALLFMGQGGVGLLRPAPVVLFVMACLYGMIGVSCSCFPSAEGQTLMRERRVSSRRRPPARASERNLILGPLIVPLYTLLMGSGTYV